MGHLSDAAGWAQLAVQLNAIYPEYHLGYLARMDFLQGDDAAAIRKVDSCPDEFPLLALWKAASHARFGQPDGERLAYGTFRTITTSVWEGDTDPDNAALDGWLLNTLPIIWPTGRASLSQAIHLAPTAPDEVTMPSGSAASSMGPERPADRLHKG